MAIQACDKPILKAAARGWKRSNLDIMGAEIHAYNGSPGIGNRPIVELDDCRRRTFLGEFDTQEQADKYAEECRRYLYRCFERD